MANDRLFLQCDRCGKQVLLYKYYPSGGYAVADKDRLSFIDEHLALHDFYAPDLEGHPFSLKTEATVAKPLGTH